MFKRCLLWATHTLSWWHLICPPPKLPSSPPHPVPSLQSQKSRKNTKVPKDEITKNAKVLKYQNTKVPKYQSTKRWNYETITILFLFRLEIALLCKILQIALLCKRPKRSVAFSQLWSPPPLCRCLRPAPLLRQKPTAPKCSDLPFNSETQFPIDNLNVGSVPCKHVCGISHV